MSHTVACYVCTQPANLVVQSGTYWCFGCYANYEHNDLPHYIGYIEDGDESEAEADIEQSDDEDESDIEQSDHESTSNCSFKLVDVDSCSWQLDDVTISKCSSWLHL